MWYLVLSAILTSSIINFSLSHTPQSTFPYEIQFSFPVTSEVYEWSKCFFHILHTLDLSLTSSLFLSFMNSNTNFAPFKCIFYPWSCVKFTILTLYLIFPFCLFINHFTQYLGLLYFYSISMTHSLRRMHKFFIIP